MHAGDVMPVDAECLGVGFVDELIVLVVIQIGDQYRHIVGVNPDVLFTFTQGFLNLFVVGDIHVGIHKATIRHGVTANLQDGTVLAVAFVCLIVSGANSVQAGFDGCFNVTVTVFSVAGVIAEYVFNGPSDTHQSVGVIKHFNIAAVPGYDPHLLIHYADAHGNIFNGGLQQGAVETQCLRGFIDNGNDVADLHVFAPQGGGQYDACG